MEASWHGDTQQSSKRWRQHTFLILTSLVREPRRWLAFFSIHLIRLLTPPSASEEALLFSQPVIWRSTRPARGAAVLTSFIGTSLDAADRRIALLALALSIPARPPLPPLDVESLELGGGVDFPILPLPLTATSMLTSPSRSPLRAPPPRRLAAGPRGGLRGLWPRAVMAAAGMLCCRSTSASLSGVCVEACAVVSSCTAMSVYVVEQWKVCWLVFTALKLFVENGCDSRSGRCLCQ